MPLPLLKKPFRVADLEAALLELTQPPNVVPMVQSGGRTAAGS